MEEKFNREIKQSFVYKFVVDHEGLYLLEITASAKSWWQKLKSLRSFFKDDDLSLNLDGQEVLTTNVGKLDARALFNGNELKNCSKTAIIAKNLNKGEHAIDFTPDKTPFLKSVKIIDSETEDKITYIPINNNPTKLGDRMPWISYILLNLTVKKISISASADKKDRDDDDDIKLCIDRVVEKNSDKKSHKDWYWCGKILKGKERKFTKDVNLEKGIHFVDLWADGQPKIAVVEIILDRGDSSPILKNKTGHIKLYKDEVKNLVECVEKNRKNKKWKSLLLLSMVVLISWAVFLRCSEPVVAPAFANEGLIYSDVSFQFNSPYPGIRSIKVSSYSPEMTVWETVIEIESDRGVEVKKYPGLLLNAHLFEALAFTPILFIEREDAQYLSTAVLFYDDKKRGMREAIFTDFDGRESNEICCSKLIFSPIDESMYAYDLSVWNYDGKERRIYSYDYTVKNYFQKEIK